MFYLKVPERASGAFRLKLSLRCKRVILTAIVFSLMPPTGSTLPLRETSPVMAIFCLMGVFRARDNKAVTIVQPALGPSFGVAPCRIKDKNKSSIYQLI